MDDAQDLFQDTIERAYKAFGKLRNHNSFKPWIMEIARSAIVAKYKRKMSDELPLEMSEENLNGARLLFRSETPDPVDQVIQSLETAELHKVIATLSFKERVFIHLRYAEELSLEAIAKELQTSPQYLGVLHHRLKQKLRTLLIDENDTDKTE